MFRRLVRMVRSACILGALLMFVGCQREAEEGEIATQILPSLVQIAAEGVNGSGVIYEYQEDKMIILTAVHVLERAGEGVQITFSDGYCVETDSFRCSDTSEVAFLEVDLSLFSQGMEQQYPAVSVDKTGYDALTEGADMKLAGAYRQTEMVNATLLYPWIYVEDFAQYMMLAQGETVAGMSGGGMFDEKGNYVGILCGVNELGQTAVVPLNIILAEYVQEYE